MALSVQTKRELLPFDMQSQAGFLFPTVIKPSSFEGAGLGRYVKAAIKKGWDVRADPIVSVDYFIENGGVNPNYTLAINLADKGDIDVLEKFWMTNDDETSEVKDLPVPVLMSWYIANVAAERTDTDVETGLGYILGHSFITNHCSDNNLQTYVDNGMLYHKAVRDPARNSF